MTLYGTFTDNEWAHLDDGTYLMRATGIEEAEIENSLYDPRIYRISLETVDFFDDDDKAVKMDAIASRKLSPNSKMVRWLKAFNVSYVKDERIDLEVIVGRLCQAVVVNKQTEQGGERSRVMELVAAPRSQNAPRAATTPAAADGPSEPSGSTAPDPEATANQIAYIDRLLGDCSLLWGQARDAVQLKTGTELPALMVDLHMSDVRVASAFLEELRRTTTATG